MDNSSKIQDILAKNDKISIAVGKNSSMDEMGAALALYLSLKTQGKKISIGTPSTPTVAISSLVGIDKVKDAITSDGGDLIVSFPYKEGEIEKVSYTLENGHLNIIVKAGNQGLSFTEKDVQYKHAGENPTLLIVIGTSRLSDLGPLFNPETFKDTTVINIDNKEDNQNFGDIVLVSSRFSSVSEQVANLISSLNMPLDTDIAQNLLSGISFATQNFQSKETSYLAFEMAALLMKKGAVRVESVSIKPPTSDGGFYPQDSRPVASQSEVRAHPQPANQWRESRPNRPAQQQRPFQPRHQQQSQQQRNVQPQQGVQQNPQVQQSQQNPQPQRIQQPDSTLLEQTERKETPTDWLMPKIYKGSTNI